jgi:hypothetical protein
MIIPNDALMTARWNQADSGFPAIQNLDNLTIGHLLLNQRPVRFHFANGDCFHTKSVFYVFQFAKQDFYKLRFFGCNPSTDSQMVETKRWRLKNLRHRRHLRIRKRPHVPQAGGA